MVEETIRQPAQRRVVEKFTGGTRHRGFVPLSREESIALGNMFQKRPFEKDPVVLRKPNSNALLGPQQATTPRCSRTISERYKAGTDFLRSATHRTAQRRTAPGSTPRFCSNRQCTTPRRAMTLKEQNDFGLKTLRTGGWAAGGHSGAATSAVNSTQQLTQFDNMSATTLSLRPSSAPAGSRLADAGHPWLQASILRGQHDSRMTSRPEAPPVSTRSNIVVVHQHRPNCLEWSSIGTALTNCLD